MLFHSIIGFFGGTLECTVAVSDSARLADALRHEHVNIFAQRRSDGLLKFRCRRSDKNAFDRALLTSGAVLCSRRDKGLPQLIYRYRHRYGLLVGSIIFALLLFGLSRFIWDIRVSGNEHVPDSEIIAMLGELGFGVGSYAPAVNFHTLCNRYLAASDNIAWISVNLAGTIADVLVIETAQVGNSTYNHADGINSPDNAIAASNLIASRDGVIVSSAVGAGITEVKPGDVVTRGTLLVSGITEYKNGISSLVRSRGSVFARTRHEYTTEIPLVREEKTHTVSVEGEKSINFFSKTIKVSINSRNLPATYDRIVDSRRVVLPGGIELPVFIVTELLQGYVTLPRKLSAEEAGRLAWDNVYGFIDTELADCELISADIDETLTDRDTYEIKCVFECVEDIARELVIGIKPER